MKTYTSILCRAVFIFLLSFFASARPTFAKSNAVSITPLNLKSSAEQELKIQNSGRILNSNQSLTEALVIKSDEVPHLNQPQKARFIALNFQSQGLDGSIQLNNSDEYSLASVGPINLLGINGGYTLNKNTMIEGQSMIVGGINFGRKEIQLASSTGFQYTNTQVQIIAAHLGSQFQKSFISYPRLAYSGTLAAELFNVSQTADLDSAKWARQLGYANAGVGLRYNFLKTAFLGADVVGRMALQKNNISASILNYSISLGSDL